MHPKVLNKKRNDMREKLIDLMWEVKEGKKHPNRAYKELCVLFNISDSHECKFYVNSAWTKLNCECGKSIIPSSDYCLT